MHDHNVPSGLDESEGHPSLTNRLSATPFEDLSIRFRRESDRNFDRQFRDAYSARLVKLKPGVIEAAEKRYGGEVRIKKLSEICPGERCIIIGTLFKSMKLKPSILREVSEENALLPNAVIENYSEASDYLILEDEIQRISLVAEGVDGLVSGIVVAVLGAEMEEHRGKFLVESMTFKDLGYQSPLDEENEGYVAFVSGLQMGKSNNKFAIQLLVDQLTSDPRIRRLLICGNSVSKQPKLKITHGKVVYPYDIETSNCHVPTVSILPREPVFDFTR